MSFALDYRKRLQDKEREAQRLARQNAGFVTMPIDAESDTRGNRRRVTIALLIAGGLLATLNSGGLVNYAYDLAHTRAGQMLVVASEEWHGLMKQGRATRVIDQIRGSVASIRETSWRDLKLALDLLPQEPAERIPLSPPVMPASTPESEIPPASQETVHPDKPKKPQGPVMRASVEPVK